MNTISNKSLILLVLMTLTLSIFTTIISHEKISAVDNKLKTIQTPTGFATASASGTAAINLSGSVAIALNIDTLSWGSGVVNQTNGACTTATLTTVGTTSATLNPNNCWINASGQTDALIETDDFRIENVGTNYVNISINGTNSTNFFGFGSAASSHLMWRGATYSTETDACGSSNAGLTTSWTEFDDETTYDVLCSNLGWEAANDQINIELNMTFTRNEVSTGQKTATIYFRAENASA